MTDILLEEGGTLDKYEGDAIIAFFGAPMPLPDHAVRSCRVALGMQDALLKLREKWVSEGDKWPPIVHGMRMRIGINTGKAVAGNLGSKDFMDFTVIGDTVNVAQRLETKASPWEVFIHKNVAKKIKSKIGVPLKEVKGLNLKGKAEEMTAYCFTDPNLTDPFKV